MTRTSHVYYIIQYIISKTFRLFDNVFHIVVCRQIIETNQMLNHKKKTLIPQSTYKHTKHCQSIRYSNSTMLLNPYICGCAAKRKLMFPHLFPRNLSTLNFIFDNITTNLLLFLFRYSALSCFFVVVCVCYL